jgi:Uma2 family endonuclease
MSNTLRWTSADLELLPEDGKRYEIVDGELFVSKQPHWYHQLVCVRICSRLDAWSDETAAGEANLAPGVIFDDDDDVAPDVVWISRDRLASALAADGKLHAAPELVVEVLSPGEKQERRDREVKRKLYSRRGVEEYWIVDWRSRAVEVYRSEQGELSAVETLREGDALVTALLPAFRLPIEALFKGIPNLDNPPTK